MIDAYIGIVDQPESMMPLEFDTYVAIEREDEDV